MYQSQFIKKPRPDHAQIQSIPGLVGDLAFNWRRIGLGSRLINDMLFVKCSAVQHIIGLILSCVLRRNIARAVVIVKHIGIATGGN